LDKPKVVAVDFQACPNNRLEGNALETISAMLDQVD